MNLLIHIGTQKTATTSIQRLCVHNRGLLKSHGYLYPRNNIHPFLFNFLAEQMIGGERERVARYLRKIRTQGQRDQCHTVIISAESFYAMSLFALYPREKSRASEYWQIEARLIEELHQCCAGYDTVKIACYLRPQDDFAASLYNQFVKLSPSFYDSYAEFIETAKPIFDYDRHIRIWEKYFGADSIAVRNFLGKADIVEDFFENFLEPGLYGDANKQESQSNPRLRRDLLEYKRIFNRSCPDMPMGFLGFWAHNQINPDFSDEPGYQVFAAPDFRQDFFGSFAQGNDSLSERYRLGELPVLVNRQEPAYPGLSAAKAFEIHLRLQHLLDKPGIRLKLALHRLASLTMRRLPGGRWLLSPVRLLRTWLKSRF